jgi:hypothetical protein
LLARNHRAHWGPHTARDAAVKLRRTSLITSKQNLRYLLGCGSRSYRSYRRKGPQATQQHAAPFSFDTGLFEEYKSLVIKQAWGAQNGRRLSWSFRGRNFREPRSAVTGQNKRYSSTLGKGIGVRLVLAFGLTVGSSFTGDFSHEKINFT